MQKGRDMRLINTIDKMAFYIPYLEILQEH